MTTYNRKTEIYGNWLVLHPDGIEMFRCTEKRANWYLKRNLAKVVENDPPTIKLTFYPKGYGCNGDKYGLTKKVNCCVVCGDQNVENLTKHHVVPSNYKKFFPKEYKTASSHDVVVICQKHHVEYENMYANKVKQELANKYDAPFIDENLEKTSMVISACKVLYYYKDNVPDSRKDELKKRVISLLNIKQLTNKQIEEYAKKDHKSINHNNIHAQKVLSKISDLQEFVEAWRLDFVKNMKPQFMPKHWNVKRPLKKIIK